jgi:teichuronic acid exporter
MSLKQKAIKGVIWSTIENFSAKGVQFILGIILARILVPEDYGLIGMIMVFLSISATFIDSGFSKALIQKKNRDEKDFSTVFYFNIAIAVLFYFILFSIAPLIAEFYNQQILISLVRVIGLIVIINSFAVVQRSKFTISIDFRTQTKASFLSIVISGIFGIYLAYSGYGVWALVVQVLIRSSINVGALWYFSKWMPLDGFHYNRFKSLFYFGSKLLLARLLDTIYNNIYLITIGKLFSVAELGYYTRAKQLNDFPSSNITSILQRVTFPLLSGIQDDNIKLKENYRIIIKLSALVIFPLMMGLAALAKPIILLILTEKWINSVWMLQLLCFAGMWYPIHALNLNILNVKGRSGLFLRLEIIKKAVITIVLIVSIPFGIKAMIIGQIFTSIISLGINTYYTNLIISYNLFQQLNDIFGVLIVSLLMGLIIYFTIGYIENNLLQLLIGFLEGVIFFISITWYANIGEIRLLPTFFKMIKNK